MEDKRNNKTTYSSIIKIKSCIKANEKHIHLELFQDEEKQEEKSHENDNKISTIPIRKDQSTQTCDLKF